MERPPVVDADLHTIRAKSANKELRDGESLVSHTWHVLSRMADQLRLRPTLADMVGTPRLWHWLYWGTFLHDFGKVADGFQAVLQGKARRWGYRHEALSLAFVDWLFPSGHPDRAYVIAVIACHHRDAEIITSAYQRNRFTPEEDRATQLIAQVQEANKQRLHHWLAHYSRDWAEQLGFAPYIDFPTLAPLDIALTQIKPNSIHRAISELNRFVEPLLFAADAPAALTGTILRGLILTADHAGSAHTNAFLPASLKREAVTAVLKSNSLFPHQLAAAEAPASSSLLISPTSSGKTEAALLWIARQQVHDGLPAPRIFYLLPYQASMNAIHKRLQTIFSTPNTVGLQHSRVAQVLFASALANQLNNDTAAAFAYQQKALAELLSFPVTVMSPYQLLKIPYQLKGFEALLSNFYGGRFILDEIHAYEPKRLALIVAMLAFLYEYCQARFFIMTATLPPQVREKLHQALPNLQVIQADNATFKRFERHRVHLLEGDLLVSATIERILDDVAAEKSVLVCCNTVRRAFDIYAVLENKLRERDPDWDMSGLILVHSRFNSRDRTRKEDAIIERTGVTSENRAPTIVVATQVVEVSLNIDLDTLYTEAAPLEALLQRFGRVNRGRPVGEPPADIYIVRDQPENVKRIYSPDLIDAALSCLEKVDKMTIDESRVNEWLAKVYTGEALERWQAAYDDSWDHFQKEVMSTLRPFCASNLDDQFYQMFDSVDVVPMQHLHYYEQLIREGKYLEAAGWCVSIAWRDYARLERMKQAWHEKMNEKYGDIYIVQVPYSSESGLDIYSIYASQNPANRPPTTALDSFDVPLEAD